MLENWRQKVLESPMLKRSIHVLKNTSFPGFSGVSIFSVALYFKIAVFEGTLATRSASLAFNFFLAIFPGILFLLSLIPFVPLDGFYDKFIFNLNDILPSAIKGPVLDTINDLVNNHGLRVPKDLYWNDVLTLINEDVIWYIRKCERRGQDINSIPKIKILTIHGSKGGEADNVVLLSELSRKSYTSLLKNGDDERRVFYTGITRTKKNLFLVRSSNDYEYSEMFLRQNFGLNRREYADWEK